jgi:catechol 2,3-dioxygenase-like lactoylglutathione lyase family enzyme
MGANPLDPVFPPVSGGWATFYGKPLKSHYIIYKAKLGDKILELLQPVSGESPWQEFLDAKGEGIHHIAFEVDNLQKAEDTLIKQGATIVMAARLEGIKGAEGGDYLDLGTGVTVEIFKGYY